MLSIKHKGVEVFMTPNVQCEIPPNSQPDLTTKIILSIMLRNYRQHYSILKKHGFKTETSEPNIAMLYTHGIDYEGIWSYDDSSYDYRPIQEWISEEQDRYSVLLINACNPKGREVTSSRAIVIHPMTDIRGFTSAYLFNKMHVYHPSKGYLPRKSLTVF